MKVSFPATFAESIAFAFLAIPNRTFKPFDSHVLVEDDYYLVPIESGTVIELMDIHQYYMSGNLDPDCMVLLKTSSPQILDLYLKSEDLESLFYVVDKVISGAESVSLDGELEVISS